MGSGFCSKPGCKARMLIHTRHVKKLCFKHYHSGDILKEIDNALSEKQRRYE